MIVIVIKNSSIYIRTSGIYLIPYFACLFFFGLPMVFLHLCIGQYSGLSANGAFSKIMPAASGENLNSEFF